MWHYFNWCDQLPTEINLAFNNYNWNFYAQFIEKIFSP